MEKFKALSPDAQEAVIIHEITHLDELNGFKSHYIVNLIAQHNNCSTDKIYNSKVYLEYSRFVEYNTDLLPCIKDIAVAKKMLVKEASPYKKPTTIIEILQNLNYKINIKIETLFAGHKPKVNISDHANYCIDNLINYLLRRPQRKIDHFTPPHIIKGIQRVIKAHQTPSLTANK